MKPTTQNILSILNSNLEKHIQRYIDENKWPNHSHLEMNGEELLELYFEIKGILEETAENGELDKISHQQRNGIYSQLNALKPQAEAIFSSQGNFNNATTHIQQIHMMIEQANLSKKGSANRAYKEQLVELRKIKKEYSELKKSLEGADSLKEAGEKELQAVSEKLVASQQIYDETVKFCDEKNKEVQDSITKMQSMRDSIKTTKDEVDTLYNNSNTNSDEIMKMKTKVTEFHGSVENSEQKLKKWEEDYNKLKTNLDQLVAKNNEQKEQITNLIQHATGASLFHAFDAKRERLKKSLWKWLLGLIIFLILMSALGITVAMHLAGGTALDAIFWVRVFSMLPMGYLVLFFSNQYSKNKNLLEEYSFKSSLSLSLEPYRELVEKTLGDSDSEKAKMADFLIDSITKIYESPTKNIFKYIQEDKKVIHLDVLEKIMKNLKP